MNRDIVGVVSFLNRHPPPYGASGVELFAREGDWLTCHIARFVPIMQLWEIDPTYVTELRKNIPFAKILTVDSVVHVRTCIDTFDLISLDNPQGIYGDGYCEHFEALPPALRMAKNQAILIFNVNLHPYQDPAKGEGYERWMERRATFYGREASRLDMDWVREFYTNLIARHGLSVRDFEIYLAPSRISGHEDFIARCCLLVVRNP